MKKSYKLVTAGLAAAVLMPAVAHAQAQNILAVIDVLAIILNRIVAIVIIIAMIWFIWGLVEYISESSGDPGKRKEGRERMVMGTIAFFVIVSIWGLVRFLQSSLGIQDGANNLRNDEIPYIGNQVQRQ